MHDIGALKRREADENREKVKAYFFANPFERQSDCAKALGLSVMTVSRHYASIRRELRIQKKMKRKAKP